MPYLEKTKPPTIQELREAFGDLSERLTTALKEGRFGEEEFEKFVEELINAGCKLFGKEPVFLVPG